MADGSENVGQDEVEAMLRAANESRASGASPPGDSASQAKSAAPSGPSPGDSDPMGQDDIEAMLNAANASRGGGESPPDETASQAKPAAPSGPSPGDSDPLGQDDIEAMLSAANASREGGASQPAPADESPPQKNAAASAAPDPGDSDPMGQDDIEAMLNAANVGPAAASPQAAAVATAEPPSAAPATRQAASLNTTDADVQALLAQAEQAIASVNAPVDSSVPGLAPYELKDLTGSPASTQKASLDLLRDVELDLRIELGRTQMYLEDVLQLRQGSVVPLDKLAGDPVDVFVNGRLVARGEILVLNDNFCVRVAELIAVEEVH